MYLNSREDGINKIEARIILLQEEMKHIQADQYAYTYEDLVQAQIEVLEELLNEN